MQKPAGRFRVGATTATKLKPCSALRQYTELGIWMIGGADAGGGLPVTDLI